MTVYGLGEDDVGRLRRMLRDYEAGLFFQRAAMSASLATGKLVLVKSTTDIAIGGMKAANVVHLSTAGAVSETTAQLTVLNLFLPKIWNDSLILCRQTAGHLIPIASDSAHILRGTINVSTGVGGGTFAADNFSAMDGVFPSTSISSVANPIGFSGDNNGDFVAIWNETTDSWECVQMECPAA